MFQNGRSFPSTLWCFIIGILVLLQLSTDAQKRGSGERAAEMKLFEEARRRSAQSSTTRGTKFANTTVWGAMILTDPMTAGVLGRDFYRVPQGVNGPAVDNAYRRIEHAKNTVKTFPFPVDMWWSVYAPECPGRKTKGNDRGVAMAHYQIWADWEYQGRKGADKATAKDTDVLIVFEDDAVTAVKNLVASLEYELSPTHFKSHLNFLGWCYGRRGMPMCTHAYALTRAGVKKILPEWDSCSSYSIDGQWKNMVNDGVFTWQKAAPSSYADLNEGFIDNPNYFTRGIFIQKNGFVSFNHHGFQNNAG